MGRHRPAKNRDANEAEIVRALEAAGASVYRMDGEDGEPDLLVGYAGATELLEVKRPISASGKTTGGASRPVNGGDGVRTRPQIEWTAAWKGKPAAIVTTPAEALAAIGAPPSGPETVDAETGGKNGPGRGVADRRTTKIPRRGSRMITTSEADQIRAAPDVPAACAAAHHQRPVGAEVCICGAVQYLTLSQVANSQGC